MLALWLYIFGLAADDTGSFEFKSSLFGTFPFTQLRLGMRPRTSSGSSIKWVEMNYAAPNLKEALTSRGWNINVATPSREAWLELVPGSSLQPNCNRVGLNLRPDPANPHGVRVRIGIFANNEPDCITPDSYLGFGGIWEFSTSRSVAAGAYNWQASASPSPLEMLGFIMAR